MSDKITRKTILTCVANCQVGMVVKHICLQGKAPGAGIGIVTAIGTDGVHIHFSDIGCDAIYDSDWLSIHP